MNEFKKLNLIEHAQKRLFEGTLSVDDFRIIIDECSKSPFEIISQKIKQMGEAAIVELKLRKQRKEEGLPTYPRFSDLYNTTVDVLD